MRGRGPEVLNFLCFFGNHFLYLASRYAMKHLILLFKTKGDVIFDHFLMLWFQKDSLDIVGFRTLRTFSGGPGFLKKIVDFGGPK